MPSYVTIVTPENVRINYELAGIASRAAAALLDVLIQGVVMAAVGGLWFVVVRELNLSAVSWVTAVLVIIEFGIFWGYYIYFESAWNGQTPGKRILRLRAVREGGLPIDLGCAALRNLIRPIDITLIGLLSILISRSSRRLGDLAAGTLVVRERMEWLGGLSAKPEGETAAVEQGLPHIRNIELVTPQEFEAIKRFQTRKAELREDVREEVAAKIAVPIMARLGIETDESVVYSELLSQLHDGCVRERGMR